jgi:hypothetical protein
MLQYDWNEAARCLARQVGSSPLLSGWGVARLRLVDDSAEPVRFLEEVPVVVAIFGSDAYLTDPCARVVVERVRRRLAAADVRELGFGLSDNGSSWVLMAGVDGQRYQTAAGKAMQHLLLEAHLEDVIWEVWRSVYGLPAGAPDEAANPTGVVA